MPTFLYTGIDNNGYGCTGAKKAVSEDAVSSHLRSSQISEFSIFETRTNINRGMYSLVNHAELALFCKQFSILHSSEMTAIEVVQLMAFRSTNKTLRAALNEIYDMMEEGYGFSESLSLYSHIFPPKIIYMAMIGEQSDALDEIFERLSFYYEKQAKVRELIYSTVAHQVGLSAVMAVVMAFLMFFAMPRLRDMLYDLGHELSRATEFIMGFGNTVGTVVLIFAVVFVIGVVLLRLYFRSAMSKNATWFAGFKLNAPLIKYVHRRNLTAQIANALTILLNNGVGLVNAMEVVTPLIENDSVQEGFAMAKDEINEGGDIGEALEQVGIFSTMFIKMAVAGDRADKLAEMLESAGEIAEAEANTAIERIASVVEPVLITIAGLVVCVVLLSVMLPLADLLSAIG